MFLASEGTEAVLVGAAAEAVEEVEVEEEEVLEDAAAGFALVLLASCCVEY